jgi:hypothetical protein
MRANPGGGIVEKQNVTLAVPKDLLRKAKVLAVERNTSLSGLLVHALGDIVQADERYVAAQERQIRLMRQGLDLGVRGKITWSRDDLHER